MTDFEKQLNDAMRGLEQAADKSNQAFREYSKHINVASHNVGILSAETNRMCDVSANSAQIVRSVDEEFCRLTGLDETDFLFLAVATALQTARWVIIDCLTNFGAGAERDQRVDHNDSAIKSEEQSATETTIDTLADPRDPRRRQDMIHFRSWGQILTESVPFDVIDGSAQFGLGLSGLNHREMTLGHDPVLGWFFGVINILTDTTTIKNGRTFIMSRHPKLRFSSETFVWKAIRQAYMSCREDKKRLAAAVAKEAIHLKSDFFSKAGLPIPIITAVLPDLSSSLYKENYDALCLMKDVGVIATQATTAILVNCVIAQLHGYFYDPKKYPSRNVYEVKTRKILLYSNILAETSNVISVAVRQFMGDPTAWKHLDFGGLGVMLWRLFSDVNYMYKVREEFMSNRMREIVMGDYEKKLWPIKGN